MVKILLFCILFFVLISCKDTNVLEIEHTSNNTINTCDISDDGIKHIIDNVYSLYDSEEQYIPYEYDVKNHSISPYDISIDIYSNNIIVHLLAVTNNKASFFSVDYCLSSDANNTLNVNDVYVYPDARNDCDYHILVEGIPVEIPLVEIRMDEKCRYTLNHKMSVLPFRSFPDDPITLQAFHYNPDKSNSLFILNDCLYINIQHFGICDVYVYNLNEQIGHWMTGTVSFENEYAQEIAFMQSTESSYNYTLNEIIAISEDTGWFAVRRSIEIGSFHGAYYLYHPYTNESIFVCYSYPSEKYATSDLEFVNLREYGFEFFVCPTSSVINKYSAEYSNYEWKICFEEIS